MTLLVACAQQSVPEISQYQGQRIEITARATPSLFDAEFILFINGKEVINDRTKPFGGTSQTFEGVWNGKPVRARATAVQKFASSYTMIDVFINGDLVDTIVV